MKTRRQKHLKYARRISADEVGKTTFVVEGFTVIEADSSPQPSERIVFRGCDQGSAHAVAQALARYWSSMGLSVGPLRERYAVAALGGRLASA